MTDDNRNRLEWQLYAQGGPRPAKPRPADMPFEADSERELELDWWSAEPLRHPVSTPDRRDLIPFIERADAILARDIAPPEGAERKRTIAELLEITAYVRR